MKQLDLILALTLGAAFALACSGGGDKPTTSTNAATDKKEQPAKTETTKTDKTKSSDSAQDSNVYTHKEGGIQFEVPNGDNMI